MQLTPCDHGVHHIPTRHTPGLGEQLGEGCSRLSHNTVAHSLSNRRLKRRFSASQIVVEKLNVPLKRPVDLRRGANAVIKPQSFRICYAGWTMPLAVFPGRITIGVVRVESPQVFPGG